MIASFILPYLITFIVGLIVGRIGAYGSGVKRGLDEAVIFLRNEKIKIWHDVNITTPGTNGDIIFANEKDRGMWLIGEWEADQRCLYTMRGKLYWTELQKDYKLWCYAKDLL